MKPIYKDSDLLIINKPAGLKDPSEELLKEFPEIENVGGKDRGACHRLDVATSGLVIFARNEKTYLQMRELFSKNKIKKEYWALVSGKITGAGKIDLPIGPNPKSPKRVKVYRNVKEARRNKAQEAVTWYEVLRKEKENTWLSINIKTGRRHQIRVHLAAIGHPIVGDTLYKGLPEKKLYLVACRLNFIHPRTGKRLDVCLYDQEIEPPL